MSKVHDLYCTDDMVTREYSNNLLSCAKLCCKNFDLCSFLSYDRLEHQCTILNDCSVDDVAFPAPDDVITKFTGQVVRRTYY
jgi:hypothetical protein